MLNTAPDEGPVYDFTVQVPLLVNEYRALAEIVEVKETLFCSSRTLQLP